MVRIVWSKIEWIQELQATGIYRRGVYYVIGNENSRKRTLTPAFLDVIELAGGYHRAG
jgi:hypothetical protein